MGPFSVFANCFSDSPPQLTLYPEKCLRSRLNTNQCQRCLERCPSNALSVNNRKISLDIAQCTGCMACVAACPQDALISDHDLDNQLGLFLPGKDVTVSCFHQVQNHPDEIAIPCVGILSKQVLAAMLVSGCRSVSFNVVGCAECRNQEVSNAFSANCRQIIEELSDIYLTKMVFIEKREQLSNSKMNRRSYLTKIIDTAIIVSKQSFLSKQVSPAPPPAAALKNCRSIPFKTQLVRKILTNLHEDSQQKILGVFSHDLSISEECNCCPLCKGICPTGAIKIDRSDQGKSLRFEMLDCSGCGLCVQFCKNNALSLKRFTPQSSRVF